MASFFIRKKSRFYWINYRDPASGKIVQKSSGIDMDAIDARSDIEYVVAQWTMKEMRAPKSREAERWETWVDAYLRERYAGTGSLPAMLNSFRDLLIYFHQNEIRTPRQMTYQATSDFLPWMKAQPRNAQRKLKHNSARNRIACLSVLLAEAVRRGFCEHNFCRDFTVKREPGKEKPEITPADERKIVAALATKPQWMRDQWTILMGQGCRVAETNVPLDRIDTAGMTITLRIKGGRLHHASLHAGLLPIIRRAVAEGRTTLLDAPRVQSWSPIWSNFFKGLGLPYSAHCTRVTVITRLLRAGHSAALVSSFVGHSEEVNRIYRRLRPMDAKALLDTLGGASIPDADSSKP